MTTETLDKLYLEISQFTEARTYREMRLLRAVKLAYQKHCLNDDGIGWDELGDILLDALCEAMGDDGYQKWMAELEGSK